MSTYTHAHAEGMDGVRAPFAFTLRARQAQAASTDALYRGFARLGQMASAVVRKLHLTRPVGWLKSVGLTVAGKMAWVGTIIKAAGPWSAAVYVLTTHWGQRLLGKVWGAITGTLKAVTWVTALGASWVLGKFGQRGKAMAAGLLEGTARLVTLAGRLVPAKDGWLRSNLHPDGTVMSVARAWVVFSMVLRLITRFAPPQLRLVLTIAWIVFGPRPMRALWSWMISYFREPMTGEEAVKVATEKVQAEEKAAQAAEKVADAAEKVAETVVDAATVATEKTGDLAEDLRVQAEKARKEREYLEGLVQQAPPLEGEILPPAAGNGVPKRIYPAKKKPGKNRG